MGKFYTFSYLITGKGGVNPLENISKLIKSLISGCIQIRRIKDAAVSHFFQKVQPNKILLHRGDEFSNFYSFQVKVFNRITHYVLIQLLIKDFISCRLIFRAIINPLKILKKLLYFSVIHNTPPIYFI